jgi:hypothetical protein
MQITRRDQSRDEEKCQATESSRVPTRKHVSCSDITSRKRAVGWDVRRSISDPAAASRSYSRYHIYKMSHQHCIIDSLLARHSIQGREDTKCHFVNSDWGEDGLWMPSAFIAEDTTSPPPTDNIDFASTKITWGQEYSHQYQRDVTIE